MDIYFWRVAAIQIHAEERCCNNTFSCISDRIWISNPGRSCNVERNHLCSWQVVTSLRIMIDQEAWHVDLWRRRWEARGLVGHWFRIVLRVFSDGEFVIYRRGERAGYWRWESWDRGRSGESSRWWSYGPVTSPSKVCEKGDMMVITYL